VDAWATSNDPAKQRPGKCYTIASMIPAPERDAAAIPTTRLENRLRPEERLVVLLAAGRLDPESLRGADWPALADTAARLGMLGHLAAHWDDLRHAGAPTDWLAHSAEAWRGQAAFNLLLAHTESELLAAFASRRIRAIPLKGVSLSRILYGSPAVRSTTDLDLLIPSAQMSAAAEMLEERGYRSTLPRALLSRRSFLAHVDEHTAETVYVAEMGGIPLQVELHWKVLPLPEETLWTAVTGYPAPGGLVHSFSPALYLLYLCAHLSGHGWRSLHWLADIAALLRKFGDRLDGAEFIGHCNHAKLRHRAGVTFSLLHAYFGLAWEPAKPLDTPRARCTAESVLLRPLEPAVTPGVFEAHRERLRLQDNTTQRLCYLWWLAHPTREEWARDDGTLRPAAAAWATRAARLMRLAGAEAATHSSSAASTANVSTPHSAGLMPDPERHSDAR
jgi:hypothetical protein